MMVASSLVLLVGLLAVVHGTALNPTTGEQECCNAAKLLEMKAFQVKQQREIEELNYKFNAIQSEMGTLSVDKECTAGWVRHGKKCYFFDTKPRVWESARDACTLRKSKLVSVETFEKDLFITTSIRSMPESRKLQGYFTSGKEVGLKSWTWMSTGQFMGPYAPWHPNEGPHADRHNSDCHIYWKDDAYKWHDIPCDNGSTGSICEKDL